MKLETGIEYAQEMKQALAPYCLPNRLEIAGSIRRACPGVGDIEIVAIPNTHQVSAFWAAAIRIGRPGNKIKTDTRYVKINRATPHGLIQIDIFTPRPYDWGRILAIRTGSADFVHRQLAIQWVKMGYRGTEHGLIPQICCEQRGGKWLLKPGINPEYHRIEFPEEIDFFNWLGLEWVDPKNRIQ